MLFSCSVVPDSLWPHGMPGFPVLHYLLGFAQTHVHRWCHPTISFSVSLFSSCPQPFRASGSFPVSWLFILGDPKYWSFNINPFNKYSGLISFRIDWLDLLAVQGTLKRLLQHHHYLKASFLWCSAFFMVQLSHHTWLLENRNFDYVDLCWQSDVSAF